MGKEDLFIPSTEKTYRPPTNSLRPNIIGAVALVGRRHPDKGTEFDFLLWPIDDVWVESSLPESHGVTMSEIDSLDQAMSEAAKSGVIFAQQSHAVTLDYSEASIEKVETVLGKLYDSTPRGFLSRLFKKPLSPKETQHIGYMFGGYIAEVLKRHAGGKWTLESSLHPGQKLLTFKTGGTEMWPQIKVQKRLENGPEDNIWHYYKVLKERSK